MTEKELLQKLKECLYIAWKEDDLISQDNLFSLQEKLADLTLAVAERIGDRALKELVVSFPFLYSLD